MFEILNHHSNQDKDINIYVKEKTKIYMEDFTSFLINIRNVRLASYSNTRDNPNMATLVPTKVPQSIRSQKSAFSILRSSELNQSKTIAESYMTFYERGVIDKREATLAVIRSSFEMNNMEVSNLDSSSSTQFLLPIFLQDRMIKITNTTFNLTEGILYSNDPLNMHLEDIFIDLSSLAYGFLTYIACNYPEASKTGMIYANNITATYSAVRKVHQTTTIMIHSSSYNSSFTGFDIFGKFRWSNYLFSYDIY